MNGDRIMNIIQRTIMMVSDRCIIQRQGTFPVLDCHRHNNPMCLFVCCLVLFVSCLGRNIRQEMTWQMNLDSRNSSNIILELYLPYDYMHLISILILCAKKNWRLSIEQSNTSGPHWFVTHGSSVPVVFKFRLVGLPGWHVQVVQVPVRVRGIWRGYTMKIDFIL